MSAHTPGPWKVAEQRFRHEHTGVEGTHFWITDNDGNPLPFETRASSSAEANAHLAAAAPAYAMAWALVPQNIRERIFDALHKPDTEWAEAAIAQAEGETP